MNFDFHMIIFAKNITAMKKLFLITTVVLLSFSAIGQTSLTVINPNGGETWQTGGTALIQWVSTNLTGPIKIDLYRNGAFYMVICPQAPATSASFTWNVPLNVIPGNNFKVKVMGLTSAAMYDFSDAPFTIAQGTPPFSLVVVAPNGGENLVRGCPAVIQWATTGSAGQPVKIELYKGGNPHSILAAQTQPNQTSFNWVPAPGLIPGSDYKIKISSVLNPSISDFSDSAFTISAGFIHVLAPNGGETWAKGTMHPITWHDNICQNVRIELWKAASFHSVIAQSVPSTGSFNWNIPNINTLVPGNDYRIRILATVNSTATTIVSDFSDSLFTILPTPNPGAVAVVNPNGGEQWITGCPQQIQWAFSTPVLSPVKIELYKNNLFLMTVAPQVPAGVSSFTWIPPYSLIPGNDYRIKIITVTIPSVSDFSDSAFTVQRGNITVVAPNGGETWAKGTTHPILWNDNICDNVRIELWKNNAFHSVIANSVPSNGTFTWSIPNINTIVPGNDYKIRILAMANVTTVTGIISDFSDSVFTINPAVSTGSVTVVTPNGGENWIIGCPALIQWTAPAAVTGMVRIELYKNNTFQLVIHPQVPAAQGNFTWVPAWNFIPGNDYKVKITMLSSTGSFDFSDGNFSISRGVITVVSPNGGETWAKGSMHPILWNDNLCDNVRIELWKGGSFHSVIMPSVPSTGVFNWMIPNSNFIVPGTDYKVKIIALAPVTGTTIASFDFSDSVFTITPVGGKSALSDAVQVEKIFPNPCNDQLTINFREPLTEEMIIEIRDRMGVLIMKYSASLIDPEKSVTLDVSEIPDGIYLFTVSTDHGKTTAGRFMVQR